MTMKGFDFKEFFLKYGERVGLGVGLAVMVLLVVWGLLGGGADVTKEMIAKNGQTADRAIKNNPVKDADLVPIDVITMKRIRELQDAVKDPIVVQAVRLVWPWFRKLPGDDNYFRNPEVYQVEQLAARPVQFAFKIIDVRNGKVMTAENPNVGERFKAPEGSKSQKDKAKKAGKDGLSGGPGMPGMPGMPGAPSGGGRGGRGGRGTGGGYPGGPSGGGPGDAGGKGNKGGAGLGGAGGAAGLGPQGPDGMGPGMPGGGAGAADPWQARWINLDDLQDKHILANNLWPARAVLILGSYPHGKQMQEIAKALRADPLTVPLLYQPPQAQRREIVPKGTRMLDGTTVTEDMVRMPADRRLVPLAKVPANPLTDAQADEAGWVTINIKDRIGPLLNAAVEFHETTDPALKALEEATDKLVMRIPQPVRGSYPDFFKELAKIKETWDKINEKGKPPPRPRDPRLPKDDLDLFGRGGAPAGGGTAPGSGAGAGRDAGGGAAGLTGTDGMSRGGYGGNRGPFGSGGKGLGAGSGAGGAAGGINLGGGAGSGAAGIGGGGGVGGDAGASLISEFQDSSGLVRFLDLDLNTLEAAGRTFEYRIRVVLLNPNYNQPHLVENPDFAIPKDLPGPWSSATRVSFPEEAYVFTDDRIRDSKSTGSDPNPDRLPVQIHKWLGFISSRGVVGEERVGDWWVDRILAARGEYLGLNRLPNPIPPAPPPPQPKPDLSLIALVVWQAVIPDADNHLGVDTIHPNLRTDSLQTRYLLADFDGGHKVTRRAPPGKRGFEEDTPAEMLVVEPNGRMFARTLLKDKESAERKTRFDTWDKWFKEVKARFDAKRPQEPPKKKDPSRPDL